MGDFSAYPFEILVFSSPTGYMSTWSCLPSLSCAVDPDCYCKDTVKNLLRKFLQWKQPSDTLQLGVVGREVFRILLREVYYFNAVNFVLDLLR